MPDSSLENDSAAEGVNESGKAAESLSHQDVNAASSTVENTDAKTSAESSTAPADKPKDMLEVVQKALNKPKADASPAPEKTDGKPATAEQDAAPEDGEAEPPDLNKEERAQLSAKTTNRMRYLDRGFKKFKAEADSLRPAAEQMRQIEHFVSNAGLTPQEVNAGFEMMRLMKNDAVKAYEAITPIFLQLRKLAGEVLPDDLKKDVESGHLPEERALEISRTKAREAQARRQVEQRDVQSQQATRQAAIQASQNALNGWDEKWKATDPNYAVMFDSVKDRIDIGLQDFVKRGVVPTPAEVVKVAEEAKRTVEARFKPLNQNRRKPIDPGPSGQPTNPASRPKPTSHLDVVRGVLGIA